MKWLISFDQLILGNPAYNSSATRSFSHHSERAQPQNIAMGLILLCPHKVPVDYGKIWKVSPPPLGILCFSYLGCGFPLGLKLKRSLGIPNSYDAKIAKICNLWTFWPVIQLINTYLLNYRPEFPELADFCYFWIITIRYP